MNNTTTVQKCRHPQCSTLVRMLLYLKTGKTAPIEARASEYGNILVDLDLGTYLILTGEELERARERGQKLHCNHFMSCEFAKQFGKSTEAKPTTDEVQVPVVNKLHYLGILTALAVVARYDVGPIFHEIVAATNEAELVSVALEDEEVLAASGLIRFGYVKNGQHVQSDARQLALV